MSLTIPRKKLALSIAIGFCVVLLVLAFMDSDEEVEPEREMMRSAEDIVYQVLADDGLETAVLPHGKVSVGISSKEIPDPMSASDFMKVRDDAFREAEFDADSDIRLAISADFPLSCPSIAPADSDQAPPSASAQFLQLFCASFLDGFEKLPLLGIQTYYSAESWENGEYKVAVARIWTPKLENQVRESFLRKDVENDATTSDPSSVPWCPWDQDRSPNTGSSTFVCDNGDGQRCYVGIGEADIQGKEGEALDQAKTLARDRATKHLARLLYSDIVARELVKERKLTFMESIPAEVSDEDIAEIWWELRTSFQEEVNRRCGQFPLPVQEIYTATTTNPVSRHETFKSIVGVAPEQIRGLGLLRDLPAHFKEPE